MRKKNIFKVLVNFNLKNETNIQVYFFMSTPCKRRLLRDFKKMKNDPPAGISGAPYDDDIMKWDCVIFGFVNSFTILLQNRPEETPWEGGTFKLQMTFTEDYPNKPPKVKFITKMFHPNSLYLFITFHTEWWNYIVYADGQICLDILQNQWSPIYDVVAILTSIQSLLTDPNPNSPANSEAARMYAENRKLYEKKVQEVVENSWGDDK